MKLPLKDNIQLFTHFGKNITNFLQNENINPKLHNAIEEEQNYNAWFTPTFIRQQLHALSKNLTEESLTQWLVPYEKQINTHIPKSVGVIMAGNIPLVGFHDFLAVLMVGDRFVGKLSSQDQHLLPILCEMLESYSKEISQQISFVTEKLPIVDKVIATGSANTARQFAYYFRNISSLIRSHCNSVAVLNGEESIEELTQLADDIMMYFGLGCRSVSKIYIPNNYNFQPLFEAINNYTSTIGFHHKYFNNLEYQKTVHLLNRIPFLDQGLLVVKEEKSLSSPIAVLHYEYYQDISTIENQLRNMGMSLQCAVSNCSNNDFFLPLGQSQQPKLTDYANGINTIEFLLKD